MNDLVSRRSVLLGSLAAGAAGLATVPASRAHAEPVDYTSRAAFDVAEQAFFDQGFDNNEGGGYAWGASYYLLGLVRMYETYRDEEYLDRFERYARKVIATTDHQRHVQDYLGRSGWVWRASGDYTAGIGVIPDPAGAPAIQVRWAWVSPADSTATVSNSSGGTFDLALYNPHRGTTTLTGLTLDPGADGYVVKTVNDVYAPDLRWTAVDLRAEPGAQPAPANATIAFEAQEYVFAVHTGMVAYPLAKYIRTVLESTEPKGSRHRGFAERLLAMLRKTVAFHDGEFHIRDDGIGDYVFPKGAPIPFDGTIEPYNQSHAMGQALVELYRVTGEKAYRDKVVAMLMGYRAGLRLGASGAYTWTYWTPYGELYNGYSAAGAVSEFTPWYGPSTQTEDISHGAISTEFVHAAREAEIDDQLPTDVARFAATYTENVIRSANQVYRRVDGTGIPSPSGAVQCARWVDYAEQDYRVYENPRAVWDALRLQPSQGSHALAIAYLNWARKKAWRSR